MYEVGIGVGIYDEWEGEVDGGVGGWKGGQEGGSGE